MTKKEIKAIIKKQRDFFNTGATLDVKFRTRALKGLYREIKEPMWALFSQIIGCAIELCYTSSPSVTACRASLTFS